MALKERNPLVFDQRIAFFVKGHKYVVSGKAAQTSVTSLVSKSFAGFDPDRVIGENFVKWKENASSKYHDQIAASHDDEAAKRQIKREWNRSGLVARTLGTKLHKVVEDELNGEGVDDAYAADVAAEQQAFRAWRVTWCAERGLAPYRTELCIFSLDATGLPAVAGCIDALFVDEEGKLWLVDWKRAKPFDRNDPHYGRFGRGPCERVKDTSFHKYTLQLAIYARMLKRLGIDVADRRYLVRLSAEDGHDTQHAVFDGCDEVAQTILQSVGVEFG